MSKFRLKGKARTLETQEPSNFKVDNPTGFGPAKVRVTIPKGTRLKVKEVKNG